MNDLVASLVRIGAIQFGRFERQPGVFEPIALNLRLLPSYPATLRALAAELAPLVQIAGLTHLLTTSAAVPLGVALSLTTEMPMVYPAAGDSHTIEGAYDYYVPTVLLTDVLTDGAAERALIKRVKGMGLEVKAVVAVLDLGIEGRGVDVPVTAWQRIPDLLPGLTTPLMQTAVREWLDSLSVREAG
jgi:orotate phosphoribosyltransferase